MGPVTDQGGTIGRVLLGALTVALLAGCAASTADRPPATPLTVVLAGTVVPPAPTGAPSPTREPSPTSPPPTATPARTPFGTLRTATPKPTPSPTAIGLAARQQLFNEVWSTINNNYLYADFHGVDWLAVRAEFEPLVAAAESNEELYGLIHEMVARLGDNHSRFLPPQAAAREDALSSGREEQVGIGVITLPLSDAMLIQHVFPDSPAERAGLRARDRIVAVDGEFYARRDLQGPAGSRVRLTVVRPGTPEARDVVIIRRKVEGRISPSARRLPGDIGYLNVTTLWVSDMAEQVAAALADINAPRPLRGLIIDLRSNPGGWRNVLTGILGHFVRGEAGSFISRKGPTPLKIEAGASPDLRAVPLVVLIDRNTASYAELLAGVLQREAGALVVGEPSAGNTETIYSYELTGGARLWVAQEGFALRDGADLEGEGVQPDVLITLDWTRYSEEEDPGIREARRLLAGQAGGN